MNVEELTQENETLKALIAEADTLKAETDKILQMSGVYSLMPKI